MVGGRVVIPRHRKITMIQSVLCAGHTILMAQNYRVVGILSVPYRPALKDKIAAASGRYHM